MNNVVSLSGGKDSTAMLHMMLERGEKIHSVIWFDTGWEFQQMHAHIDMVEQKTGLRVWRLQSRIPFEYWLVHRPIVARAGVNKGSVYRIGNGWPSPSQRWCTKQKTDTLDAFSSPIPNAMRCIGYAADEGHRQERTSARTNCRYPLIEYGITELEALQYCYALGYDWGGLYKIFPRVSCFCCPLKSLRELENLRRFFPELWAKMLEWDAQMGEHNRVFKDYDTVHDLEKRFSGGDSQILMPHRASVRDAVRLRLQRA